MDSPIKINVDLTEENVLCIMPNILNKKWQQFMEIDHTYEFSSEFTDILKSLYLQIQKPKNERKEYNLYLNQIDNCISAVSIISDEAKSLSENEPIMFQKLFLAATKNIQDEYIPIRCCRLSRPLGYKCSNESDQESMFISAIKKKTAFMIKELRGLIQLVVITNEDLGEEGWKIDYDDLLQNNNPSCLLGWIISQEFNVDLLKI